MSLLRLRLFFVGQGELWKRLLRHPQYYYTGRVQVVPIKKQRQYAGLLSMFFAKKRWLWYLIASLLLAVAVLAILLARTELLLMSARTEARSADKKDLEEIAHALCWPEHQKRPLENLYDACKRDKKKIITEAVKKSPK